MRNFGTMLAVAFMCLLEGGCVADKARESAPSAPAQRFTMLMGWDLRGSPGESIPQAAAIGVTDIIVPAQAGPALEKTLEIAHRHGINVYALVQLNTGVARWAGKYPHEPPPLQGLTDEEQQSVRFLRDGKDKKDPAYSQWGGEPVDKRDVLIYDMLSFHDPRVMDLLKDDIRAAAAIRGIKGIAFDVFGYQNFRCDRSPAAMKAFEQYRKAHPSLSENAAFEQFSFDMLVKYNNALADFARSLRPDIMIANHVWPSYAPQPLYGNRLDIDYCGQSAAWFLPYPPSRIATYAMTIARQEKLFHQRASGVALIGFFNQPGGCFPVKSADQVESELKAILAGGCNRLMVCSIGDVLRTPAVADVFRKYCNPKKTE